MRVYLASPGNQTQAHWLEDMPVLLSYATFKPYLHNGYVQSFSNILIDSGAFSELNSGKVVDGAAYMDWYHLWLPHVDAVAGLDDIRGDWRRSLRNYELYGGFPTIHDTDPIELLDDLIPIAREQGRNWIGIGLLPPRQGKEAFIRNVCDRMPEDLHVHGWALRAYTHIRRLNSVDSTNWYRDAFKIRTNPDTRHLTYSECVEIVVKRYKRWQRNILPTDDQK